jgi:hypothetical protein
MIGLLTAFRLVSEVVEVPRNIDDSRTNVMTHTGDGRGARDPQSHLYVHPKPFAYATFP